MANPIIVACSADTWTKVATNVTTGQVHIKNTRPVVYLHTYRMTGDAAPAAGDSSEGVQFDGPSTPISAAAAIDVYIMPRDVAGSVRVDV